MAAGKNCEHIFCLFIVYLINFIHTLALVAHKNRSHPSRKEKRGGVWLRERKRKRERESRGERE